MSTVNSFGAKSTLDGRQHRLRDLPHRHRRRATRSCRSASRCCSRTCCAPRTARTSRRSRSRRSARGMPTAEPDTEIQFTPARVVMQDFTGVPCIVDLATMREAVERPRRRPEEDQPALARPRWSSTTRSSPTCSAPRTPSSATSRSSTSATASATSSSAGARPRSTTSRSSRRAPASCTRSTSSTSRKVIYDRDGRRRAARLPRHLRRHRLAHHDGQRPRRARLGRRRHRGRGRDARPARVDAHPARSSASSSPARSRPA